MKKCPYCAEEIEDKAIVCLYCGRGLVGFAKPAKNNSSPTVILFVVGGLILITIISAASNAAIPGPTPTPTHTKAPTWQPTSPVTVVPTRTPRTVTLRACVANSTVRIRKGPGTDYEIIGGMASGTCFSIVGRNTDATWAYMVAENNKAGWVAAELLTIDGNLSRVSVQSNTEALSLGPTAQANCSPAYPGVCIPPAPPDLACGDIPYRLFIVQTPDPHGFDRDEDGVGCE